jgi:hypothetical protein
MSEMDADSNGGPSSDVSRGDSESLSDGEGSMACSDATENSVQDSRKRTRPKKTQTQGKAWIFEGEITTDLLPADSDSATSLDGDVEDDSNIQFLRAKSKLQAELGANFETFFGHLSAHVSYFVIFCNLFTILDIVPDPDNSSTVKIGIQGFLQSKRNLVITQLRKLLPPRAHFISGDWMQFEHGLSQNTLFKACVLRDKNNPWMVLHETGQFGLNNNARKLMRTASRVFFEFNYP